MFISVGCRVVVGNVLYGSVTGMKKRLKKN